MPHTGNGAVHISDPIDTDTLDRLVAQGQNFPVGSPRWAGSIRSILRILADVGDSADEGPRAAAIQRAVDWMIAQEQASPGQYGVIFEETATEVGLINPELVDNLLSAGDILVQGGATGLQDILRTVQQDIDQTRTETTTATETGDTQITERRDVFIDIPTAEKVLDDFRTSAATFAQSMFDSGSIDPTTRDFLMANPNILLGSYLSRLGQMADEGKNIFEVVGTEFELIPIEQIGERLGPTLLQDINTMVDRIETGDLTIEELTERVQNDLLSGGGTDDQQQQIQETVNEIFNRHSTGETTENTVSSLLQLTTERLFQRPELDTVFALSGLDFLRENFTPTGLELLAKSGPGKEQFQRQFAGGVAPSSTRRLR